MTMFASKHFCLQLHLKIDLVHQNASKQVSHFKPLQWSTKTF